MKTKMNTSGKDAHDVKMDNSCIVTGWKKEFGGTDVRGGGQGGGIIGVKMMVEECGTFFFLFSSSTGLISTIQAPPPSVFASLNLSTSSWCFRI